MAQRGQQVVKPLRVNTDLANELMPSDYAAYLKNVITDYNTGVGNAGQDHNTGTLTPCVSNVSIDFEGRMPAGTNICVGSRYDRRLNQFYWFNYNSNGNHTIWVYNGNDNTVDKILQSSLLNFSPRKLITSIDVVIADVSGAVNVQNLQRLLYWTDGNSDPKKINVDVALAGGYAGLDFLRTPDEYFLRVKYPPLDVLITGTLANPDPSYLYNFVANKQFQFRYRYYYQDGERSTWSSISTFVYTLNQTHNFFELSLDAGSSLVTFVEIGVRLSNTDDWKSVITISYDLIISNTTYPYDNVTNIFIYKFFNNEQYGILDQDDTNRPFSIVPLKSFAQAYTEQNVLIDGNILEGFDNFDATQLALPDVTVNYHLYTPLTLTLDSSLSWTITAGTLTITVHVIDAQTGINSIVDTEVISGGSADPYTFTTVITNISYGDLVYLSWAGVGSIDNGSSFIGTYTNITEELDCGTGDFEVTKNNGAQAGNGTISFNNVVDDDCSTWSTSTNRHRCPNFAGAFNLLKQGGVYKFAIAGYDSPLRQTFVQPLADGNKTIDSIQKNNQFQTNEIEIDWNGIVLPDCVKYIKVLRTKNLVIDRTFGTGYIQFGITFDNNTSTGGFLKYDGTSGNPATDTIVNLRFTLEQLIAFNTDNYENTTTSYTYTQGDRIQFIRNGDGTWYNLATYGLIDLPLATDPTQASVTFLCEYNPSLASLMNGAWVEIYTPAKKDQVEQYYEIGDFIPMTGVPSNNQVSVATTTLNTFDTYPIFWSTPYINATVNATSTIPFEHHSIYATKIVPSNGEDIGRVNVINVSARQLWYPARVRWSFAYLPNTFVNGLSMNAEANVKDFNRAYGNIVQLFDNFYNLLILQEDNCFVSVLAKQLVTLADGSEQLVATNTFISNPIELSGDFGCQNSESFQEDNGKMWWTDVKRGAFCECDWKTIVDISRTGMIKSYAARKLKYIYKYNQDEHLTQTCVYDLTGMTTVPADGIVNILIDGTYVSLTVVDPITDAEDFVAFFEDNDIDGFVATDEFELSIIDPDAVYGNMVTFDDSDPQELLDEFEFVCNMDFFTVPAGYDPKNKMYLPTMFNMNDKGQYWWNIAAGFETGESINVSIVIDGAAVDGDYEINNAEDIITALNDLADNIDIFNAIENDTIIDVTSSSGSVYGTIIIGEGSFSVNTTDKWDYINNEYQIEIARNETAAYSIFGRSWNGWYGFTPEYYSYIDAQLEGISLITFKKGFPYFHNLYTTTTYNEFYGDQTDQVITPVFNCNSPATEKRFMTLGYNSANKTSTNSGTKYLGYAVVTSDFQESVIPIAAFKFRENFYYAVFFRNTTTGATIQTGQPLRGRWIQVTLVRDTDEEIQPTYNELSELVVNFETSPIAILK